MTQLNFGRDVQGYNAYAPRPPTDNFTVSLTNGVAVSKAVPTSSAQWIVVVSGDPGTTIWMAVNATADNPAGATLAASTSELNPGPRLVFSGDTISIMTTNATADAQVAFWSVA